MFFCLIGCDILKIRIYEKQIHLEFTVFLWLNELGNKLNFILYFTLFQAVQYDFAARLNFVAGVLSDCSSLSLRCLVCHYQRL